MSGRTGTEMACLSTKEKKQHVLSPMKQTQAVAKHCPHHPRCFGDMPVSKPPGKVWSEVGHGGEFVHGGGAVEGSS